MNDLKLIVITRRDLSPGNQGTQSIHVVSDHMLKYGGVYRVKEWKETSNSIIWLSCNNEDELYKWVSLYTNKYPTLVSLFFEPDLDDELTAICFIADGEMRKKLSSLPLALKK